MTDRYLVYTDKGPQEGPELKVLFVVEQGGEAGGFGEHLSERRGNLQTTLDQVAHAEHTDEALSSTRGEKNTQDVVALQQCHLYHQIFPGPPP